MKKAPVALAGLMVLTPPLAAQTYTILHSFTNTPDGANPYTRPVLAGSTLFGTTFAGGSAGQGTVFKLNTNGTEFSVLKTFTGGDGANPWSGVIVASNTLYGTTRFGGSFDNGVVYRLTIPIPPPLIVTTDAFFGVKSNPSRFGFTITGQAGLVVVIEACTNMALPSWISVATNTLGGGMSYFFDLSWTNRPARFYRVRVR